MSTIFSGLIASAYSISINEAREIRQRDSFDYLNYDAEMAIASVILALCIVAFVIGIWSGCCLMTCCGCCATPEQVRIPNQRQETDVNPPPRSPCVNPTKNISFDITKIFTISYFSKFRKSPLPHIVFFQTLLKNH